MRLELFTPSDGQNDPGALRQARLIVSFGFLGGIFGSLYAGFDLLIGHRWGALTIAVCTLGFLAVPWLLRRWGTAATANLLCFIMIAGFAALCSI